MIREPTTRESSPDERAVTELLSFVLIFSIVLTSVALVGLVGFQAIEDYQENERLANAERSMDAFATNGNQLVKNDAVTHRSSDLRLRQGTVSPGEAGTRLEIRVTNSSGPDDHWSWDDEYGSDDLGAFVYESGGPSESIAYVGGGVFRESDGTSGVLSEPMITCREETNTALISLAKISEDGRSIQSSEAVEFRMAHEGSTREYYDEDVESVEIEVDSGPYEDGWQTYLENDEHWNEGTSQWECDADRVSIDIVEIDIDYPELDD
ncbi:DUF7289 family protein [Natrarchaeobius chitinivorans]|uniref:Uncharacterized protein n=1 Tax=Natrarchaeobius chitinivorans TaxID=1679083 RepID=A0A3N6LRS8_NATCH|nr:hypothetical protein [Natrarchaeobius chitinivorans]RQG92508.1 hypothetical protein EA473_15940 [Natrarchaeobius chitinivorans]